MPAQADRHIARTIRDNTDDLDRAAKAIVEQAFELGSKDNLTVQIVRVEELLLFLKRIWNISQWFGKVSQWHDHLLW